MFLEEQIRILFGSSIECVCHYGTSWQHNTDPIRGLLFWPYSPLGKVMTNSLKVKSGCRTTNGCGLVLSSLVHFLTPSTILPGDHSTFLLAHKLWVGAVSTPRPHSWSFYPSQANQHHQPGQFQTRRLNPNFCLYFCWTLRLAVADMWWLWEPEVAGTVVGSLRIESTQKKHRKLVVTSKSWIKPHLKLLLDVDFSFK